MDWYSQERHWKQYKSNSLNGRHGFFLNTPQSPTKHFVTFVTGPSYNAKEPAVGGSFINTTSTHNDRPFKANAHTRLKQRKQAIVRNRNRSSYSFVEAKECRLAPFQFKCGSFGRIQSSAGSARERLTDRAWEPIAEVDICKIRLAVINVKRKEKSFLPSERDRVHRRSPRCASWRAS